MRLFPSAIAGEAKPAAHAQLACATCHGNSLLDQFNQLKTRLGEHTAPGWDRVRDEIQLGERTLLALSAQCGSCHEREAKEWSASSHALRYGQSFLNREHNRMEPPMDDCLRCHAMFFQGSAHDLVRPLGTRGSYELVRKDVADHPSIPCLACHQIHPERWLPAPSLANAAPGLATDSVTSKSGFFDRREGRYFPAHQLPVPKVFAGDQRLEISDDARLRGCYQCHAPSAAHEAGTSDDRTLRGVHEGLSCFDCHGVHSLATRNSCADCHPAASNCGLDVTRMDTTARAKTSRHDIHTVACRDCHPQGPPKRGVPSPAAAAR